MRLGDGELAGMFTAAVKIEERAKLLHLITRREPWHGGNLAAQNGKMLCNHRSFWCRGHIASWHGGHSGSPAMLTALVNIDGATTGCPVLRVRGVRAGPPTSLPQDIGRGEQADGPSIFVKPL